MYVTRTLERVVLAASHQFPVVMVIGPMQVGKTTFLRHLAKKGRNYVTLDDPTLVALARSEPKLFLERFSPPVLIDEIQYAPELLPYIKMEVDRHHQPGQYWLTGSQQFHLMKGVSESLAGRVGVLNLLGLSQWENRGLASSDVPFLPEGEELEKKEKKVTRQTLVEVYQTIWIGSFPAMLSNKPINRNLFYSSYLQTYLQRDIRDLAQVVDERAFLRFLKVAAARSGQLLNFADLARDTDVSPNTAKNWLSILQTSGIIYLLEPYHNNLTKRLIKTPKMYFLDTGLCSYLTGWSDAKTLEAGAMSGAIFETFVVIEIIKSYWHNGLQAPLFYYRDKDKKEIDLLILKDQTVYPVEIKKSGSPRKEAVKHFQVLNHLNAKIGAGGLICLTDQVLPITSNINAIPAVLI